MDTDPPFGERLRQLREAAHMTRTDLADASGLHRVHVCGLESGRYKDPGWNTVRALADALGVPTDAFRSGAGNSEKNPKIH